MAGRPNRPWLIGRQRQNFQTLKPTADALAKAKEINQANPRKQKKTGKMKTSKQQKTETQRVQQSFTLYSYFVSYAAGRLLCDISFPRCWDLPGVARI